ncbi:MAG TPA: hypothetical protein VFV50_01765 [Bdellovibrionales bacterium]|nr:hypothetical protein [Bdellovibrionales bacterium]
MRSKIEIPLVVVLLFLAPFFWKRAETPLREPASETKPLTGASEPLPAPPLDPDAVEAFNTSSPAHDAGRAKYTGPTYRAALEAERSFLRNELKLTPAELEQVKLVQDQHHSEARKARRIDPSFDYKGRYLDKERALVKIMGPGRYGEYKRFLESQAQASQER